MLETSHDFKIFFVSANLFHRPGMHADYRKHYHTNKVKRQKRKTRSPLFRVCLLSFIYGTLRADGHEQLSSRNLDKLVKQTSYPSCLLYMMYSVLIILPRLGFSQTETGLRSRAPPVPIAFINLSMISTQYKSLVPIYVFPEIKQNFNVLSPSSYSHLSVRDLYISRIGLPILLQENMWTAPGII
jgi:hypothetical protein